MTDNEIMKALECCTGEHGRCVSCPLRVEGTVCIHKKDAYVLDLINRQKAEIERLKAEIEEANVAEREAENQALNENKEHTKIFLQAIEHAKSEVIKEFAERLKSIAMVEVQCDWYAINVDYDDIDNIVKEMMEVQENDG